MRPPPRPTLFPYTTLFRSLFGFLFGPLNVLGAAAEKQGVPEAGKDRKSTRLNSSHVSISYAVFGLKKKIVVLTKVENQLVDGGKGERNTGEGGQQRVRIAG